MDEQHHITVLADPDVADLPSADVGRLDCGSDGGLVRHAGIDHRARLLHHGVQVIVTRVGWGDQRYRAADGHVLTHSRDDAPQRAGLGCLQGPRDFVRLDVRELVADAHVVPLSDDPAGDLAELHR